MTEVDAGVIVFPNPHRFALRTTLISSCERMRGRSGGASVGIISPPPQQIGVDFVGEGLRLVDGGLTVVCLTIVLGDLSVDAVLAEALGLDTDESSSVGGAYWATAGGFNAAAGDSCTGILAPEVAPYG